MQRTILISALLAIAAASQASITMATFSDPSNGSPFLFDWDQGNNTLSGSWTGSGMTVQTPGFTGGGLVSDAHFSMSAVSLTTVINNVFYELPIEEVVTYRERVQSITPDDIQRVAREYIRPDRLSMVLVGNAKAFVNSLRAVGFTEFDIIALDDLDLMSATLKKEPRAP